MRISDWSSDVCSSDLWRGVGTDIDGPHAEGGDGMDLVLHAAGHPERQTRRHDPGPGLRLYDHHAARGVDELGPAVAMGSDDVAGRIVRGVGMHGLRQVLQRLYRGVDRRIMSAMIPVMMSVMRH